MELNALKRERVTDAAYDAIRGAILGNSLAPGTRLNIEELAQQLGVSLTPVRHAIQQLATEGLIEVRPRGGTYVAHLSAQDVEESFAIRRALECLAAETAVERITAAELRRMKELLRALRKPVRSMEDRHAHEQANTEFHLILIRASGNSRLLDSYESLNAHLKIARLHAADADWPTRLREEEAEHEAIYAALEARNIAALTIALRQHIGRAQEDLLRRTRAREAAAS